MTLDDYIFSLVDEKLRRLDTVVDNDVQQEMQGQLKERINAFINRRLIDQLTEDQAYELEVLLDAQNLQPDDVQQFIESRVPDQVQVVTASLLEFAELYLGSNPE